MTTAGVPVPCDLACELRMGAKAQAARMRSCSLSRCFVQTDVPLASGASLDLYVTAPGGDRASTVQARVQRGLHDRWIDDAPMRGVELRLIEVGPSFFAIYAALCDETSDDTRPSLSIDSAEGDAERDRRRSSRSPLEIPVRLFAGTHSYVGVTRDLSTTGAFIESDVPRSVGECLHLEFLSSRSFFAEGSVVRTERAEAHGFAVRFIPIDELIESSRGARERGAEQPLHLRLASIEELAWLYAEQVKKSALFVPGSRALPVNTLVDVTLEFGSADPHRLKARVVRVFDRPAGLGLQILHCDATAAWCEARLRDAR